MKTQLSPKYHTYYIIGNRTKIRYPTVYTNSSKLYWWEFGINQKWANKTRKEHGLGEYSQLFG